MVLRQSSRLVRLYKRAYKRRSFPSYLPANYNASECGISTPSGTFSGDLKHYQSHVASHHFPTTLQSYDLFIRQTTAGTEVHPLAMILFDTKPEDSQRLEVVSAPRNWETVQSFHLDRWQEKTILHAQAVPKLSFEEQKSPDDPEVQKAHKRRENLANVAAILADNLPKFFTARHNFSIYSQDIVFENRIRGVTTTGLKDYVIQLNKYKSLAHLVYSFVRLDVLKITEHDEDNSVRVRWRIQTMGGVMPFLQFWKLFNRQKRKEMVEYIDGFSTFVVGDDGLVHKHIADKMMPDDSTVKKATVPEKLAKLAAFVGFMLPLAFVD